MNKIVKVLLVEDNELDVRMFIQNAKKIKLINEVEVATDGPEALRILREHKTEDLPDLIVLDLSLPGLMGHEVLDKIRADPRLHDITVLVLTSSSAEVDIETVYKNQAAAFITKPLDPADFIDIVKAIDGLHWQIVKSPKGTD